MPINIKSQKDVLRTEVSVSLPVDLNELDQLMKASKSTGKLIATYNQGGLLGVNVEQNTRIAEKVAVEVRNLTGVDSKEI